MAVDGLGRTVLAGQYEHRETATTIFALVERWVDGIADTTFGPNGSRLFNQDERLAMREESFTAVSAEPGGAIFAAGWGRVLDPTPHHITVLGRFMNDGGLDRAFGIMGAVEFRAMPYFAPRGMLADGLGVLLVGAPSPGDLGTGGHALRVLANGVLDSSFGDRGHLDAADLAALAAPLRVGQDYLVAAATLPGRAPALLRLTSIGTRSVSFGEGGLAVFPGYAPTFPVALEPATDDGWLFLVGQSAAGPNAIGAPLVLRVRRDGTLDPTFADRGALFIETGLVRPDTGRQSLAVLCDGSFLVLREDRVDGMIVTRFTAAGAIDRRFGDAGSVYIRAGRLLVRGLISVEPDRATARVMLQASDRRIGYFRIAL